jgi:MFS family permease
MLNGRINRWWTVVGGSMAMMLGSSTVSVFMFGIFAKAIGHEYGWSRPDVSLGLTAYTVGNGIGIYLIGAAIDRWGARRTTAAMVTMFGVALASVALVPRNLPMFVGLFAVIGFFGSAGVMIPYAVAVCAQFDRQRGFALGIVNAGNAVGGMLFPLVAVPVLERFGWRVGYVSFGSMCALVPLLCVLFLVRVPEKFELERKSEKAFKNTAQRFGFLRQRHFWLLFIAVGLLSFSTFGITSQIVPILTDSGHPIAIAAGVLATVGVSSLCARMCVGFFVDRFFAPYVTSIIFVAAMGGIWLIVHGQTIGAITAGALLLGVGLGAEGDLITFLVSRYFPIHSFGTVSGAVWMTFAWGGAIGTLMISNGYDAFKSYGTVVTIFMALIVVAIACVLALGPYIFPPEHQRGKKRLQHI